MSKRRDIRRLAMQLLYQIDVTGELDRDAVLSSIDTEYDSSRDVREQAVDLALHAWITHGSADERVAELAPDWPTHRQPPVDRAILRLAHHEMSCGRSPVKVAINEAVELAKQYCGENSPTFINGVLDKLARKIRATPPEAPEAPELPESFARDPDPKAWLKDAAAEVEPEVQADG